MGVKVEKKGYIVRLYEAAFGSPKKPDQVKPSSVAVLGAVEQSYGIYVVPSFREMVTVLWDDPILKEAVTMFAEQVVATGIFLTSNPKYTLKLNGLTALEVIKQWCDDNNIDPKLLEISIELKAFGNSLWRIDPEMGFVKIPIEAVWHAVRVDPEDPLQEKYNMQLVPLYGSKVIPWGEFIHFRVGITGYHAPFGQGVMYGLLAKPVDSKGVVAPSIYDIRLSTRGSLNEGFRKFSFGNELWVFEGMSNEDFDSQKMGEKIAKMSSTGNRIATNAKGQIHLAVPERTQSYDEFIKHMRDEFFMSLADPSLKLGLEQGFTKATSVTASEVYKYKIATMRKTIKQHFEDLFKQILDKLGYDGRGAGVQMNFGPDETAEYTIPDIFTAVKDGVILKNEARKLLSTYHKWDISGDIEGGDKPSIAPVKTQASQDGKVTEVPKEPKATPAKESTPQIIVIELADAIARYSKDLSKIYIDPLVPEWMYKPLLAREVFEYTLEFGMGMPYSKAEEMATLYEKNECMKLGIDWSKYDTEFKSILARVKARGSVNPPDVVDHSETPILKETTEDVEKKRIDLKEALVDLELKEKRKRLLDKMLEEK